MQLVVVMAVKKAVSAATITFTAISMILPFFIMFNDQCSMFNRSDDFHFFIFSFFHYYSESSPPELFVNVLLVTSLLTPSLMAMAFTVVVSLRLNASL